MADFKGERIKLPDFLVVGALRSATTSLYFLLKQHPGIFMPSLKEPSFFYFAGKKEVNKNIFNLRPLTKFEQYSRLFHRAAHHKVIGEASGICLSTYSETIPNIKKYHPRWGEVKIIIILRNPVDRLFSHYLAEKTAMKTAGVEEGFRRFCLYLKYGLYYEQVRAYKENFSDVRICLFEDYVNNSSGIAKDIFAFIGVDAAVSVREVQANISGAYRDRVSAAIFENILSRRHFIKYMLPPYYRKKLRWRVFKAISRKPELELWQKKLFSDFYKNDIVKLQDLISRDLSGWLK